MIRAPKFAYVIVAVALVSLLLSTLVAWRVDLLGDEEERRDCQRAIAAREDNRTMWLYALDLSEPETAAERQRLANFTTELDKRLPALTCRGGDPVSRSLD